MSESDGSSARDPPTNAGVAARIAAAAGMAGGLARAVDARTVTVDDAVDGDDFFTAADGRTTVANRYDLEKAVPLDRKPYFREVARYCSP
ncbi:hypothetical protein [Halococcus sp. IIIV-5B]|uniref:hypothetical protein n=1 Tax=Halococcus sp. IIIV-5B TaxID=2321230 RepID=UPI001F188A54|nr:hypothetical protein [Halococcus sp. IIIV-5B]